VSAIHEIVAARCGSQAGSHCIPGPNGQFRKEPASAIRPTIVEDAEAAIWVTDSGHGFRRVGGDRNRLFDARGNAISRIEKARSGLPVSAKGSGVSVSPGSSTGATVARATVENGLLNDEIASAIEDRDGNMWQARGPAASVHAPQSPLRNDAGYVSKRNEPEDVPAVILLHAIA